MSAVLPIARTFPIELTKYLGLVAMVVDHVAVYSFEPNAFTELVGCLAFPLFVAGFAVGCQGMSREALRRVLRRMIGWAAAAQVSVALVRPEMVGTVLATFTLGLVLYLAASSLRSWVVRAAVALSVVVLSVAVEYMLPGVVLVWASLRCAQHPEGASSWVVAAVALVCLQPFNGSHGALLAIPVLAALRGFAVDVPRVPRLFYVTYVAQFPVLRLVREVLS